MKKFLTMLLALVMVLSLAACSSQKGGDVNGGSPVSAVDLLTAVWNAYPESEKFPVVGGSLDKPVDDAPGTFPVDDADNLDYMLHFPADKADLIDDAASLTHMMNALEQEIGFSLPLRDHRGVRLTAQGRRLYPQIRQLLSANRQLQSSIAALRASMTLE